MTNKLTGPIHYLDATAQAELIRTKQISSREVVQAHLDRINAVNSKINAIVTLPAEEALQAADAADKAVSSGAKLGPLHGVPFTAKDSIDTAGVLTQRGSPIFKGRLPNTDATSVARLKSAGAILLAKTNLPNSPTGSRATICSRVGRTILGISSAPPADRVAESRRPSRRECRRSVLAPISPSLYAVRRRIPVLLASKPPMDASQ